MRNNQKRIPMLKSNNTIPSHYYVVNAENGEYVTIERKRIIIQAYTAKSAKQQVKQRYGTRYYAQAENSATNVSP